MIGGRLRVLSYENWPYGHGVALDDILKRANDVDRAYTGSMDDLREVIQLYNVSYVYVGGEELSHYPGVVARFDSIAWLKPVYNGSLRVYKVAF
jgi:uncharacterized membrane protein